jgi:hypothetical protein
MLFEIHGHSPLQHLIRCLAVIRGGEAVSGELLEGDLAEWIALHGIPTRESVDAWAADSFELGFAIRVLVQRPVGSV